MKEYIKRTSGLQNGEDGLFISTVPPHTGVTKSTIARWLKTIMQKSGIDIAVFRPHSCRAASTSAAYDKGMPIATIMKAAGWSSAKTYYQYHKKLIQEETFSTNIIDQPEN